ncbi:uncharacterized protein [Lolium perenne]|uniref:uncharacterized protein isoform X1 n=1 Tax=Lolium perenne TaxID=4522 RepID=UPI0021F5F8B3|nr:uncharacterized protein LOC127313576 isoform X1 [Lolium perenne]XP_051200033.1 uncharacterized protein LOC127313576 isoform X1 [Lolium perenne]XP_051200039.1 uncharacterized protein LOC127313576 isoform X1 [Lolium perenne]XP_051200047.1 uncharacterized protein LOC127313576 isoform X1 [Lolium perenne]XP_051200052.1 uncharacterized protein LOC127313576 isoform X1 [Lolium perenne]
MELPGLWFGGGMRLSYRKWLPYPFERCSGQKLSCWCCLHFLTVYQGIQAKEATESAFKDGKQLLKLRMGLILASVVRVILSRMMIPVTIHVWFFSSNLKQGTAKRTETHLHGMKTGELGNAPC